MPGSDDAYRPVSNIDRFAHGYFQWLCDKAGGYGYKELLYILHDIEFAPSKDDPDLNRAIDGMNLRWIFASENELDIPEEYWNRPCSLLELFVSLAVAMDDIMYTPDQLAGVSTWFLSMMTNMGLAGCTDREFASNRAAFTKRVRSKADIFLNREYGPDGYGGPFPMYGIETDMRNVELWYQMNMFCERLMEAEKL